MRLGGAMKNYYRNQRENIKLRWLPCSWSVSESLKFLFLGGWRTQRMHARAGRLPTATLRPSPHSTRRRVCGSVPGSLAELAKTQQTQERKKVTSLHVGSMLGSQILEDFWQ